MITTGKKLNKTNNHGRSHFKHNAGHNVIMGTYVEYQKHYLRSVQSSSDFIGRYRVTLVFYTHIKSRPAFAEALVRG